jgi:hypothetical protein
MPLTQGSPLSLHRTKFESRFRAGRSIVQFWNVTPKNVNRSISQLPIPCPTAKVAAPGPAPTLRPSLHVMPVSWPMSWLIMRILARPCAPKTFAQAEQSRPGNINPLRSLAFPRPTTLAGAQGGRAQGFADFNSGTRMGLDREAKARQVERF